MRSIQPQPTMWGQAVAEGKYLFIFLKFGTLHTMAAPSQSVWCVFHIPCFCDSFESKQTQAIEYISYGSLCDGLVAVEKSKKDESSSHSVEFSI
jgi:hypothetical protein